MFIGSFYRKRQLHFIVSNHCFRRRGEEYVSESDNSPRERPIVAAITSALNLLAIYKMKGECLLCWIWPTWWMPARQGHFFFCCCSIRPLHSELFTRTYDTINLNILPCPKKVQSRDCKEQNMDTVIDYRFQFWKLISGSQVQVQLPPNVKCCGRNKMYCGSPKASKTK